MATSNPPGDFSLAMAELARSVTKSTPMFSAPDMRATVRWYESIGFTIADRYEEDGELLFARLTFGNGELAFGPGKSPAPREASLWFFTDRVTDLYQLFKRRHTDVIFDEELYEPFYGGRQFSIRDNNGLTLVFWQPAWLEASVTSSGPD